MFSLRRVSQADVEAVRAQLIDTWHATYDGLYGRDRVIEITGRWHSLAALTEQCQREGSAFLMAEQNGCVLASSYAYRVEDDGVHLSRLYVSPASQGRGIGKALMDATFTFFPGAKRHRLEVEPQNAAAIAFYARNGFMHAGRTSDCGGSSGLPGLIMTRVVETC